MGFSGRERGNRRVGDGAAGTAVTLHLHDTMSRELVAVEPIEPGHVRMYTCGPTVWNRVHIGNFRTFIFEDVLRRWLDRQLREGHPRDEPHRRRRPDHQERCRARPLARRGDRAVDRRVRGGSRHARHPAGAPLPTRDRVHRADGRPHRAPRAAGAAYRADGSYYFHIAAFPALRQAERRERGGARRGRERPDRRRRLHQRGRPRLRALEGGRARRDRLGHAHRTRPSGLAHRMLGDEHDAAR